MLETEMKEKENGIIEISEISLDPMLLILEYIYTGNLPISGSSKGKRTWEKFPGEVVYAADKYDLPLLKRFCEENLLEVCNRENAKELFDIAKLYKFDGAKKQIWEFIQRFVSFFKKIHDLRLINIFIL